MHRDPPNAQNLQKAAAFTKSAKGDVIHVHCAMQGFLKVRMLSDMNRIDMGIALAHLYVEYGERFRFFKTEAVKKLKGYGYIGSFDLS